MEPDSVFAGVRRRNQRSKTRRRRPVSQINVTPFVDVMLVLLIIFMVSAPLLTVGVPVELPQAEAVALNAETRPITLSIDREGRVHLQETRIDLDEVVAKLQAIASTGYDERIYIRGDRNADYGTVMRVMARISSAGYRNLGLVTVQEQDG